VHLVKSREAERERERERPAANFSFTLDVIATEQYHLLIMEELCHYSKGVFGCFRAVSSEFRGGAEELCHFS